MDGERGAVADDVFVLYCMCRLGSFLNSGQTRYDCNLAVREISTPLMTHPHDKTVRHCRQFYYTTRDVVKGEEALHYFVHTGEWATGRWVESETFARPARSARELVTQLAGQWDVQKKPRPNKVFGSGTQCMYCCVLANTSG